MTCPICQNSFNKLDYKNPNELRKFLTGQLKIKSSKYTGLCKKHQRLLANQVKIARQLGLLPFTRNQERQFRYPQG